MTCSRRRSRGADGKPLYPEMTKDAMLFGGTDPGRFCPTYMIFCDSFIPHGCQPKEDQSFDRRDVYIITQNALADGTYLYYIRAQYNRSAQIDPPFFQELCRPEAERRAELPDEPARPRGGAAGPVLWRAGRPGGKAPARLARRGLPPRISSTCPRSRPGCVPARQQDPLSKYLYENLRPQTQQLLSGQGDAGTLARAAWRRT